MLEPFFLAGSEGRLFCHVQRPAGAPFPTRAVLCVPPFAEEMNKSRRMFNVLGQRLVAEGLLCMLPDLFGTGDSEGDFADANTEIWLDDLQRCVSWLQEQGVTRITLLGLRAGALLAMQAVTKQALPVSRVILWQPAVKGKLLLTQFLRIRLASGLVAGSADQDAADTARETTGSLREEFARGRYVEVAGYRLSPQLAGALDSLSLADMVPPAGMPVDWLELSQAENDSLLPVSQKVFDQWHAAGAQIRSQVLSGASFWSTQEIAEAAELVEATVALVSRESDL